MGSRHGGIVQSSSQVAASLGHTHALPKGYFGINYDYGGATIYQNDSSSVPRQLGALTPRTLRWPAGTGANYFQWQQGFPVAVSSGGSGSCAPPHEAQVDGFSFTLAKLAAATASTGAVPIFDLNVMSASLSDQIAMLHTAHDTYKLPIQYLELGNEFYLCNTDYVARFKTAQDYGQLVAKDVVTLHNQFPGALIAAVGSANSGTTREMTWNAGLLSAATGKGKPDVITLHDHPRFQQSLTVDGLPTLFTEPYTSAAHLQNVSGTLSGLPVWITEYSLSEGFSLGNPAQRTYANALFEDEAAVLLTQTVKTATLIDYWSSFGPNLNYAYSGTNPTQLTPVGLAMKWLDQAAGGAGSVAPIVFSGGPTLGTSGDSALVGDSFPSSAGRHELLVNLSGRAVAVASGAAIPSGATYQQVTGDPIAQIPAASQLTPSSGTVGQTITLAPYSLTRVG